jgi:hypothetical protein
MSKARVKTYPADPKKDLADLETAMKGGAIPARPPGSEVQAATAGGARVVIPPPSPKADEGATKAEIARGKKRPPLIIKGALKEQPATNPNGKPVQQEIKSVIPKLDAVGRAAKKMTEAIKNVAEWTEAKGNAEGGLIKAMKKARRTSINCEGFSLFLDHKGPVDKIKIQKPK